MIRDDMRKPTREGVLAAAASISELLAPTPLLPVEIGGVRCHVKAESLQPIGAFKIRGGWWRLSILRGRASAASWRYPPHHAQGVAGRRGNSVSLRPRDAAQCATSETGGDPRLGGRSLTIAPARTATSGKGSGAGGAGPAFAMRVIEGKAARGRSEAQLGAPWLLVVAGWRLAAASPSPVRKRSMWPRRRDGIWSAALQAGKSCVSATIRQPRSAMRCPMRRATIWRFAGPRGPGVTDGEVRAQPSLCETRLVVEPGGAAALAATLAGKVPVDADTVIMLTGGNTDAESFAQTIARLICPLPPQSAPNRRNDAQAQVAPAMFCRVVADPF